MNTRRSSHIALQSGDGSEVVEREGKSEQRLRLPR